jgi:catechol 2,3-dioxygenase-like lactoylglutathione lyase family enzyme
MKRMHIHLAVEDLNRSIGFYSTLFGAGPAVVKSDYAKWMLDDPRVNFAISTRGQAPGLDHLGIQVETKAELAEVYGRLKQAGDVVEEHATTCCYAESDKNWVGDPQNVAWEAFLTRGESTEYGSDRPALMAAHLGASASCCAPPMPEALSSAAAATSCCVPTAVATAKQLDPSPASMSKDTGCCS